MRSECKFFHPSGGNTHPSLGNVHPSVGNNLGFHWEDLMKPPPPIMKTPNSMRSTVRVPVIVRNDRIIKEDLSNSMKGLALD